MGISSSSPLFVVGASRSGTALIRSALNNHPDIHLAGETHYFDDLRLKVVGHEQEGLPADLREQVEGYFLALGHRPYGHQGNPGLSRLDRKELRDRAREFGTGADAYFEAFCRLDSCGRRLRYWGEKTPRHVYRISEIVTRYPTARVICMVRDPRAVVASYRDWRNRGGFDMDADPGHADAIAQDEQRVHRSYHLVTNSLLWRSSANAARQARDRFGATTVLVQRYEELVRRPEETLRGITDWLRVPFAEAMLDVPMHNSSVAQFDLTGGVSTEPLMRWRHTLSPTEIAVIQQVCGASLQAHGYQADAVRAEPLGLARIAASFPVSAARAVGANRSRIGSLPSYIWRRLALVRGG